jgi:hypothetical protein
MAGQDGAQSLGQWHRPLLVVLGLHGVEGASDFGKRLDHSDLRSRQVEAVDPQAGDFGGPQPGVGGKTDEKTVFRKFGPPMGRSAVPSGPDDRMLYRFGNASTCIGMRK